jgi:UDP-N-acetylmuramoyl-tripeptide--D-alanyl-D-alanine ligase
MLMLDAYNANPASMKASVEAFVEEYGKRELTLVLGDMKELGPESGRFHAELGAWLAGLPLKAVYLAGPEMAAAAKALSAASPRYPVQHGMDPKAWTTALKAKIGANDALLFKASRAMKLEELARAL